MLVFALALLFGIMLFSVKSTLLLSPLELGLFFALLLAILAVFKRHKSTFQVLVFFAVGFAWMWLFSNQVLNPNIDEKFFNTPTKVVGTIVGLPQIKTQKTKFELNVSQPFKGKIKLAWYQQLSAPLRSGDEWQLNIKIKKNNGYQNQGGFDYEQWLFYQQFDATGYVKRDEFNKLLSSSALLSIHSIRQNIRQHLTKILADFEFIGVINALIIGDRSILKTEHWDIFKATNTTHLSVISGLHIGLISGFIFLLASFLWRQCYRCSLKLPANIVGAYFGLISALIYALIAGFSIPTQRAFIMASVVFLAVIFRRTHNVWQLYGGALFLVLALNPLSVFSVGFWLSFYVVAIIIYAVGQHKNKHWLFKILYIQLLISIATLPLTAWFFSQGSLLSPIANIIAIPVFSFITTPFALLGALLSYAQLDFLAQIIFSIANQSLIYLSNFLQYLQTFEFNLWHYTPSSSINLILLITAILIILLPNALKFRKIALILLIIIWLQPIEKLHKNEVLITTLDVGQGLSHVVQTKNHTLIFDTGARYASGFNMGDAVIIPYLNAKQINTLDLIIISHGDNDHIGGLKSLLENIPTQQILSSVPDKILHNNVSRCNSTPDWEWDGVLFQMLNFANNFTDNNASCVLKISNKNHSILLTGDIEKQAERYLLDTWGDKLKSDILISPHHGSKTSSSELFLSAVSPDWVVISSGYKNRFKHPAKSIIAPYQQHAIKILNTSCTGQIDIKLNDKINIDNYRQTHKRYYWRQCD
jgi:competence protein ComEC